MSSHLDSLNPEQKKAVLHKDGPLLILAGAGAGKTKVITHRILELILGGVAPEKILAVTFTNKAAKEMRERVSALLKSERLGVQLTEHTRYFSFAEAPHVSTFHSLGVSILREFAREANLPRHFSIYDRTDSVRAVKEGMKEAGVDPKQFEPRKILGVISRQKGDGFTLSEFRAKAEGEYFLTLVLDVWEKYELILAKEKALDFDDLLLRALTLLRENGEVRRALSERWRYLHIDEYQDTNKVQYEITKILASARKNLCVVGDIDQMIYSWRGATLKNILHFEKDYPAAVTVLLEENYRSTKNILHASNKIIKKNELRREKNLYTKNEEGERLSLYVAYDEGDEARYAAGMAKELIEGGTPPEEIAVLYRANFQSRVIEEAMLFAEVPYQVLGVRFFERKEVKDVLSYVRAALNSDSMSDIKRAINTPPRGIGKTTLLRVLAGEEERLPEAARGKVRQFRKILADIKNFALAHRPSEAIKFVLATSGFEEHLKGGSEEDVERLENIHELVTLAKKYDALPAPLGVEKLLEDAALATDQDEMEEKLPAVKLMTVHASKGLEFSSVFITGLEEGLFPHEGDEQESQEHEEEERRLFYVALTRAKRKVFLSYTSMRTIFGAQHVNIPSEFITDIPEDVLEEGARETPLRTIYLE